MIANNKLNLWEIKIPGNFGINFKVPVWIDSVNLGETLELYEFIKNNYQRIKTYNDKSQEPTDYMSWQSYNLFAYDLSCLENIKKNIFNSYINFTREYNVSIEKELWINGWVNVLEPGCEIPIHNHSMHENSYLSGFINFTENDSTTDLHLPQLDKIKEVGVVHIPNHPGTLALFPQWTFHSVSRVTENLRISIGFDLHTVSSIEYSKTHYSDSKLPIHKSIRLL
jgi:hypothetical protein